MKKLFGLIMALIAVQSFSMLRAADVATVVSNGTSTNYTSLQTAIDAADANATILLIEDCAEKGTEVEANSGEFFVCVKDKQITIDLNEKTFSGSFYVNSSATLNVKNGTIHTFDGNASSGIESVGGHIELTDVTILTTARHAVRVKGGTALINSGSYTTHGTGTMHALNISHASIVTIEGGTFVGPKGFSSSGNAVMLADAASKVTIEGGMFTNAAGVEGCISAAAGLTISGGTFDTWTYDNYLVSGYGVTKLADDKYVVEPFCVTVNDDNTAMTLSEAFATAKTLTGDVVITLTKDVTLSTWTAADLTGATYASLTITGGETVRTITGITQPLVGDAPASAPITFKNLVFKDVAVTSINVNGLTGAGVLLGATNYGLNVTADTIMVDGGKITSEDFAGGLVGYWQSGAGDTFSATDITVKNLTLVSSTGGALGGLIGHINSGTVSARKIVLSGNTQNAPEDGAYREDKTGLLIGTAMGGEVIAGVTIATECKVVEDKLNKLIGRIASAATLVIADGEYFSNPTIFGLDKDSLDTIYNYNGVETLNVSVDGLLITKSVNGTEKYVVIHPSVGEGFVTNDKARLTIWGEALDTAAKESLEIRLYADETYLGKSELQNVNGIIDGNVKALTWHFDVLGDCSDEYWKTTWETAPTAETQPTKVELWLDGCKYDEATVNMSRPDGLVPVVWSEQFVAEVNGTIYCSLQAAIDATEAGETVTLLTHTLLDTMVVIKAEKTLTLDLNGKSITVTKSGDRSLYAFENNGTFTLVDSVGIGSITARGNYNFGTMVMEGGTIVACDTNGGYGIWNNGANSDFTMNGGTVKVTHVGHYVDEYGPTGVGNTNASAKMKLCGGTIEGVNVRAYIVANNGTMEISGKVSILAPRSIAADGGTVTVSGGTISTFDARFSGDKTNGSDGYVAADIYYPLYVSGGEAIIIGGTFNAGVPTVAYNKLCYCVNILGKVTINGGIFNGAIGSTEENDRGKGTISITGGQFKEWDPACNDSIGLHNHSFVATGKIGVRSTDGYYTLADGEYVAKTATQCYATVPAAVAVATGGDTVTVLKGGELEWTEGFALPEGVTVRLDDAIIVSTTAPKGYIWEERVLTKLANWVQVADTAWFTDDADMYTITTAQQLAGFAKLVNEGNSFADKTVTLGNDISLAGLVWPGIGVYSESSNANAFQGVFDGATYTISDVTFADNTSGNKYRGFFNQIYKATVKDLTVAGNGFGETPPSGSYGGALIVGFANDSTIENCIATGKFSASHNVAGIVVRIKDATLKNCTNKANLTGSYSKMGGIVNLSQNSQVGCLIEGCVNEGMITSTAGGADGVGGIIGWIGSPSDGSNPNLGITVTIKDCMNCGVITATASACLGQIVGKPLSYWKIEGENKGLTTQLAIGIGASDALGFATVEDNVATYVSSIAAGNTYLLTAKGMKPALTLAAGETIAFDQSLTTIDATAITAATELMIETAGTTVTYSAAIATIGETPYATLEKALAAVQSGDTLTVLADVQWPIDFALVAGVTIKCAEGIAITTPTGYAWSNNTLIRLTWDHVNVATTEWYGDGLAETFTLATSSDLGGLAKLVNEGVSFKGKTILLSENANYDLAAYPWTPIGTDSKPFAGNFDGQGATIKNLTINEPQKSRQALFGLVKDNAEAKTTFANVTLTNVNVTGKTYVAGIIANAFCVDITNCHINGDIYIYNVGNNNYTGAIVGHAYANILNCSAKDTGLDGNGRIQGCYSGGIVGFAAEGKFKIEGCSVENIDFVEESGAIAGFIHRGIMIVGCSAKNCTIDSTTGSGSAYAGLIAGQNYYASTTEPTYILNYTLENVTGKVMVGGTYQTLTQLVAPNANTAIGTGVTFDTDPDTILVGTSKITGGVFITQPLSSMLAPEAVTVENADGTWTVLVPVATLPDGTYVDSFESLEDGTQLQLIALPNEENVIVGIKTQGTVTTDSAAAMEVAEFFGGLFTKDTNEDGSVTLTYHYEFGIVGMDVAVDGEGNRSIIISAMLEDDTERTTLSGVKMQVYDPITAEILSETIEPAVDADGVCALEVPWTDKLGVSKFAIKAVKK